MSLLMALLAAIFASSGNLFLRKNSDFNGNSSGYLVLHFSFSLLVGLLTSPAFRNLEDWSTPVFLTGGIVGLLNIFFMRCTAKALKLGDSGLTFAFQNSGCVLPALLLAIAFGSSFGFIINAELIIGTVFVLLGLFWAAKKDGNSQAISTKWLTYSLLAFSLQALILTSFQWRCLLIKTDVPSHALIPFKCTALQDGWFMPGMFLTAAISQAIIFFCEQKRFLNRTEIKFGSLGGLCNGVSTVLLLQAAQFAASSQQRILFPLFAIGVIIFCNAWGQKLYKEKINWLAYGACCLGIIIAALN
jgi:hypothetical protein